MRPFPTHNTTVDIIRWLLTWEPHYFITSQRKTMEHSMNKWPTSFMLCFCRLWRWLLLLLLSFSLFLRAKRRMWDKWTGLQTNKFFRTNKSPSLICRSFRASLNDEKFHAHYQNTHFCSYKTNNSSRNEKPDWSTSIY